MQKRIFFIVSAILVTVFIFGNSFKDANSSGRSSKVFVEPISEQLTAAGKTIDNRDITYFVRKSAHILEFALQGFLITGCVVAGFKKRAIYVLLLGTLTACTDEFIQFFSDGRAPMFRDILLDFTGCVLGFFVFLLIHRLTTKLKTEQLNS